MPQAKGTVTALDGEYALVKTESGGCGRCHEDGGCQGANVGRMFCSEDKAWRVLNPRGAKPGERVDIEVSDGAINASAMLIYVIPLLLFIGGAAIGVLVAGDFGAIIGSVCGLAIAWFAVRQLLLQRRNDARFQPYIV